MTEPRFADLDPSQTFERGWNRLQAAVEIVVLLIVVAGLLGLLGTGPLSSRQTNFDTMPLQMTYERITRRTVQTQMTIKTTAPMFSDTLEIELPSKLANDMDVVSTSPRSTSMRAESKGIVDIFALGAGRLGTITFSMKPRTSGLIRSAVKSGAASAPLTELVLP